MYLFQCGHDRVQPRTRFPRRPLAAHSLDGPIYSATGGTQNESAHAKETRVGGSRVAENVLIGVRGDRFIAELGLQIRGQVRHAKHARVLEGAGVSRQTSRLFIYVAAGNVHWK